MQDQVPCKPGGCRFNPNAMPLRHDFDAYQNILAKQGPPAIFGVFGSDRALNEEAIHFVQTLCTNQAWDFNHDIFNGREFDADRFSAAVHTLPMMASRRFVHVMDLHELPKAANDVLLKYVQAPASTTTLCLSGQKPDLRTLLGKQLASLPACFLLEPPGRAQLPAFIKRRADRLGITIDHDAIALLAMNIQAETASIDMALDRAFCYHGDPKKSVDVEAIRETCDLGDIQSIFALTDAIGNKDKDKARMALRYAMRRGDAPLQILAMITRQLRMLLLFRSTLDSGISRAQALRDAGVPPFLNDSFAAQAKHHTTHQLMIALQQAMDTDSALKGSAIPPATALEQFIDAIAGEHT